jgi:hypothetical protein
MSVDAHPSRLGRLSEVADDMVSEAEKSSLDSVFTAGNLELSFMSKSSFEIAYRACAKSGRRRCNIWVTALRDTPKRFAISQRRCPFISNVAIFCCDGVA